MGLHPRRQYSSQSLLWEPQIQHLRNAFTKAIDQWLANKKYLPIQQKFHMYLQILQLHWVVWQQYTIPKIHDSMHPYH
jgi:hypothetical protein